MFCSTERHAWLSVVYIKLVNFDETPTKNISCNLLGTMMAWTCFEGFFWRSFAKIERIYNFEFIWYSWIRLGPSIPRLLSQTFFLFVSLAVGGERLKFKNLVFFLWKLLPQHVSNLCEPLKKFDEFWWTL